MVADEMGLGKTVQAIAVACYYEATDWPVLIVVPASLKLAWASEIEKWAPTMPTSKVVVVKGRADVAPFERAAKGGKGAPSILIMTYALFVKGSPAAAAAAKLKPPMVILDESHYVKQRKSQRAELLAGIMASSQRLLLLSGTPALARPAELYPQVRAASVANSAAHGARVPSVAY
jgi:SWI/SNF-related matrix-associated actin-dependent regulator of chromatin subfamily A-like protein 1